jgi:hypothetical protein
MGTLKAILEEGAPYEERETNDVREFVEHYGKDLARAYVEARMARLVEQRGVPAASQKATQHEAPEMQRRAMII